MKINNNKQAKKRFNNLKELLQNQILYLLDYQNIKILHHPAKE